MGNMNNSQRNADGSKGTNPAYNYSGKNMIHSSRMVRKSKKLKRFLYSCRNYAIIQRSTS